MTKPRPRKHAELIKAWADDDSLVIQYRSGNRWVQTLRPLWNSNGEYRIASKPKKEKAK